MARRWTPQRFITLRRVRIGLCVAAVALVCIAAFIVGARRTVALSVNGETRTVTTYTQSVDRLLQTQNVKLKTHDVVKSTSDGALKNHDTVSTQSAYQATITIEGQEVPFWTVASSADQLLGFFKSNDAKASAVTVNLPNVYNQLTGGIVINKAGPVTVIADGKSSVAPNGKLTAASILDSKGITLGKEDRVSVEDGGGTTILRVQRVTQKDETQDSVIPFGERTIVDNALAPGTSEVRQQGVNGVKRQNFKVTYVDGQAESKTLASQTVVKQPIDEIIAVGPAAPAATPNQGSGNGNEGDGKTDTGNGSDSDNSNKENKPAKPSNPSMPVPSPTQPTTPNPPAQQPQPTPAPAPTPTPAPAPTPPPASNGNGMWHATSDMAKIYARGALAARGWTGEQQYDDLVNMWKRESGWLWWKQNPTSTAYGIPQLIDLNYNPYPNYHDDAGVQIGAGLDYIANRYGNPSNAWRVWQTQGWY